MRQQVDNSMKLILERLVHYTRQYDLFLSQNNVKLVKTTERQLAWIVRVVMSLFSYGLPSATSKILISAKKKANS